MEFAKKNFRRRQTIVAESSYPNPLQFYVNPPTGSVSLQEFDELASERLKIIRAVERINLNGHVRGPEDFMVKLYEDFSKNKYFVCTAEKTSGSEAEIMAARRRDHVSHFILRLAYCRTEELRRWFVMQETDLFRARFLSVSSRDPMEITSFLQENGLNFTPISQEEVMQESVNLFWATSRVDSQQERIFYKVPFTDALELVRGRKVFLKQGFAYVPSSNLVTLVASSFRSKLSHCLAVTSKVLPQLEDDERLVHLLQDFDKRYTGNEYGNRKPGSIQRITPEMVNHLATTSFPLCMRQLQETLHSTHHLKHGGRMQYGLFLKAIGMTLEDALVYWRSHFTKVMDIDKFEKSYAYNIRHNYGKEGKRINYSPYSCVKIITTSVGPGDSHGCPFKYSDSGILRHKLLSYRIPHAAVNEIMDMANKGHYQIACQLYWEASHNSQLDTGINHPNQYFEESRAVLMGNKKTTSGLMVSSEVKTQHSVMYSQTQSSSNTDDSFVNEDFHDLLGGDDFMVE